MGTLIEMRSADTYLEAFMELVVSIMILWTLIFTVLSSAVLDTLMTNTDVEAIRGAVLATWVTTAANGLTSKQPEVTSLLLHHPL